MVLLTKDPTTPWNQVIIREALKISGEVFKEAVAGFGQWVNREQTSNSIQAADRVGSATGNGYWAGDQKKYDAALRAAEDRSGGVIGTGSQTVDESLSRRWPKDRRTGSFGAMAPPSSRKGGERRRVWLGLVALWMSVDADGDRHPVEKGAASAACNGPV